MKSNDNLETNNSCVKKRKFKNRTNKRWIKERRRIDRKELRGR